MAKDSWLNWTLVTVGLAGAGFAAGLHRFVWGLFWLATLVWWLIMGWLATEGPFARGTQTDFDVVMLWVSALGPPLLIGVVLRFVERIVFVVFGISIRETDSSVSNSRNNGPTSR
jgi:hypothetical protein